MYARVNHYQDSPENLDSSEQVAEKEIVPQLKQVAGFLGVLSMVDRTTGKSLAITFWESEEALRASETAADELRDEIKERTGSEIRTVDRYEVTLRVGI
jgi:heme-degrading monooxygenase HmoA